MDRRGHRRAGVLIALAIALHAGTALAQGAEADRAREMFRQGVEHMNGERWQQAAEAFRASYDASPRVATMCNLALAYDRWGAYPDVAADAYERCAREDTSGRYREHAEERAAELRAAAEAREEPAPAPPVEQQLPPDTFEPDRHQGAPVIQPQPTRPVMPPAGPVTTAPPERGHGLLYAGLAVGAVSLGTLVGGVLLASSANGDAEDLRTQYPTHRIPRGSAGEDTLDSAESKSTWAVALYVISGATAALAAALIILDVAAPEPQPVAVAPVEGGAIVTASAAF